MTDGALRHTLPDDSCSRPTLTVFDLADFCVGRLQSLADLDLRHTRRERVRYRFLNRREGVALSEGQKKRSGKGAREGRGVLNIMRAGRGGGGTRDHAWP